jgi:bifunctional non-homologous end joining protein LigD
VAYSGVLYRLPFIPPQPLLRSAPPREAWVHEIKFDGWRIHLHKRGNSIAIYTRSGADFTPPAFKACAL